MASKSCGSTSSSPGSRAAAPKRPEAALLFLAGHRAEGGADAEPAAAALRAILAATPYLPGARVSTWRCPSRRVALAWTGHDPADLGGVEPVACEDGRAALVSGRPIRWRGDGDADGREPIHGAAHLGGILDALDGRYAVVRVARGVLEVRTDDLGAHPLYSALAPDGTWWTSGLVAALVQLGADRSLDARSVAGLVACGWPLDGQPGVRGVRRLPRGGTLRISPAGERSFAPGPNRVARAARLPGAPGPVRLSRTAGVARLPGRPLDVDGAARDLVAAYRALDDWPGRPRLLALSGGRDSRLVLAAALASGRTVDAVSAGGPDDPEVRVARELCAAAGIPHRRHNPPGDRWMGSDPVPATGFVRLLGGTCALFGGVPVVDAGEPPPLWHSGQGGELARAVYGRARGPAQLVATILAIKLTGWRPRRPLPSPTRELLRLRTDLARWAAGWRARSARTSDLLELAYLDLRMGFWAGPAHAAVDWVRTTTSPLWSWKLLPALLSGTFDQRRAETLHRRLVAQLAPELLGVPFDDGTAWPDAPNRTRPASAVTPGRESSPSVSAAEPSPPPPPPAVEPHAGSFRDIQALVRDGLASPAGAAVAPLLDLRRVHRLLSAPESQLGWRERSWVWQLLTATGTGADEPPGAAPAPPSRAAPTVHQARPMASLHDEALARVREICLGLPATSERPSHGSPAFFVDDRHTFVMFLDDHHGDGRLALWCAAPAGAQALLVASAPERYFVPPYVGHRGWIGVRLDRDASWEEIAGVIEDAWLDRAPKRRLAELDGRLRNGTISPPDA